MVDIGTQIFRWRTERGMDQTELAERAKVTRTYIGEIEKGFHHPGAKVTKRIADALGLTTFQLAGIEAAPSLPNGAQQNSEPGRLNPVQPSPLHAPNGASIPPSNAVQRAESIDLSSDAPTRITSPPATPSTDGVVSPVSHGDCATAGATGFPVAPLRSDATDSQSKQNGSSRVKSKVTNPRKFSAKRGKRAK